MDAVGGGRSRGGVTVATSPLKPVEARTLGLKQRQHGLCFPLQPGSLPSFSPVLPSSTADLGGVSHGRCCDVRAREWTPLPLPSSLNPAAEVVG